MPQVFQNLELSLDDDLKEKIAWMSPGFSEFRILRESIDARQKPATRAPLRIFTVEVAGPGERLSLPQYQLEKIRPPSGAAKPIVVGSGPAGLFAALRLAERGVPCLLLERGSKAEERIKGINRFWRYGTLDPRNNVCFGEGGAGLYSDGKLITRIKSPYIPYVMHRLVQFGAPAEIQWLANPHVGSDRIRRVIPFLRQRLIELGCEIRFDTKVSRLLTQEASTKAAVHGRNSFSTIRRGSQVIGIETEQGEQFYSDHVVLATGHSAEDMLLHLRDMGVAMEAKSFAVGLRVEHPQSLINSIQYRAAKDHPSLGAANYKLTHHDAATQIGVYSFCMCPGGYVLSSGTESDGVVSNGMSNFKRNSPFANAALVVSVAADPKQDPFEGMRFRRKLEQRAYQAVQKNGGTKQLPVQGLMDFLQDKKSTQVLAHSSPSGATAVELHKLLPKDLVEKLQEALIAFEKKMPGFLTREAQLFGVESRTSCPVRISRDAETLESLSHSGLYPCGEGAGFAGGITSAACDGIRIAEKIVESLSSQAGPSLPATKSPRPAALSFSPS